MVGEAVGDELFVGAGADARGDSDTEDTPQPAASIAAVSKLRFAVCFMFFSILA